MFQMEKHDNIIKEYQKILERDLKNKNKEQVEKICIEQLGQILHLQSFVFQVCLKNTELLEQHIKKEFGKLDFNFGINSINTIMQKDIQW